jgi:Fur family transcriptional regulator, peroxide stress response regulator
MKYQHSENSVLTPQRDAVLQAVRESHSHLTASEVYESARQILPTISYATVYNSLRYLKDNGFISEIQFGNGASRYDAMTERHDHALCTICGKLVDLELELSDELITLAAQRSNFEPQSLQLTLKGLCENCRTK